MSTTSAGAQSLLAFEYGYDKGKAGYHWHKTPPGYQE